MTAGPARRVLDALEATWPPARAWRDGAFTQRDGAGGGKRVSAATADGPVTAEDIEGAERAMSARGLRPLFRLHPGEEAFDAALAEAGYGVIDPTVLYAAPVGRLVDPDLPRLAAIACDAPLAVQREIWETGGIGPDRLAVMARVDGPKTYLLGRAGDRPAGTAFVALDVDIAMIHAIAVLPSARRGGVGRALLKRSAAWAGRVGAVQLALAVTEANGPARALYASLGMEEVGRYHYRIAPGKEDR